MKICTTADWHITSSRSRIDAESGLNARLVDVSRCAAFVIQDAVERGAQLILHGGDIFDGCRPTPTEAHLVCGALLPALKADIPVILLLGNHDMPRNPNEQHALDLLAALPGVTIVDQPGIYSVWRGEDNYIVERAHGEPQIPTAQIACLPYPNKQLLLADDDLRGYDSGQLNVLMREKLMDVARGLAMQRLDGVPCLLLAHGSVDTAQAGAQNQLMMLGGEWTYNVHDLDALGFDGVCLGHIHKPQVLSEGYETMKPIWYTGSIDICAFGEEGERKQYQMIDFNEDGIIGWETVPTPFRTYATVNLSAAEDPLTELQETCEGIGGIENAIVRVRVPQVAGLDLTAIRRRLEEMGAFDVQIEVQRIETARRSAEIAAETALEPALRTWAEQRPETLELTDELLAEAVGIESQMNGGAA